MPSSVGSAAFALALVVALTGLAGGAAIAVALLAFAWEAYLFFRAGR